MVTDRIKSAWLELTRKTPPPARRVNGYEDPGPKAYNHLFTVSYTGEKNIGEIGPIVDYKPDYAALRLRSWQAYLDSDLCQTVIKKYRTWMIGSGLKLQAQPAKVFLKSEKVEIDTEAFNEVVESRFAVYAASRYAHYGNMKSLHKLARLAFRDSIVGGDVLVIMRYIDGFVKVQLIDGAHVGSPIIGNKFHQQAKERGNKIRHGVEISPTGEHVAYYLCKPRSEGFGLFEFQRIEARSKSSGLQTAFMVYGLEWRLDSTRGMPLIAAVLESAKKLERYKEATLGSAEERQKIAYAVEHGIASTGENPLAKNIAKAFNVDADVNANNPVDVQGKEMANLVAATTNKAAFNMPIDSKLSLLESKNELYFKDFYTVNIDLVCAALEMPPEVAMSKYDSNFSASRAALKDWEHKINVGRWEFYTEFYANIYAFWLDTQILENRIQAPGYLEARATENLMLLEAYRAARFTGPTVPHVDPLKEVKAEREKLGDSGRSIPLTTVEQATEALNGGDSDQNMLQYSEELKESKRLGIKPEQSTEPPDKEGDDGGDGDPDQDKD